jgi:hypothetical protein
MATKQIQCPNCGATINVDDLKGLQCPYCGGKIERTVERERSSKKSYKYDGIVPFTRSEEEARQTLAWRLADEMEVPIEVFNDLDIKVKKIFVPAWQFEGSFKSPWSCQKVVTRRREYKEDGKTRYEYYDEYYPANGVAVGNFRISVSGVKYKYGYLPFETPMDFSTELIESDATVENLELSIEEAWKNEKVKSRIEYLSSEELRKSLPDSYTDLNSYYEYNYNYCACILYPVYEAEFDYDGETYINAVSGSKDYLVEGLVAPRQDTVSHEDDHDLMAVNDSSLVWSMTAWGAIFLILGVVLAFISGAHGYTLGVVSAVVLSILSLAFPFVTYSRIEDEKSLRRNIAEDREEHDREIRFQQLMNEPLLQPYREEMEETAELNISSVEYNEKVRRDKAANTKFKMILIVMSVVSAGIFFASAMARSAKIHAEQEALDNRMDRIMAAYNQITPQMFFHDDKDNSGHLRQDIRETLTNMGFVRDDEHRNSVASSSNAELYSLYMSGETEPIMQIVLNENTQVPFEEYDDITDIRIKYLVGELADEGLSSFTNKLAQIGFVDNSSKPIKTTGLGTTLPYASFDFIRIGRTKYEQGFLNEELYFNYDVVYVQSMEIVCNAHADSHIKTSESENEDIASVDTVAVEASEYAAAEVMDEAAYEVEEASEEPAR